MATSTTQLMPRSSALAPGGWTRPFLLLQSATFLLAATLHFGVFAGSYADARAAIPESVIASVLLAGLIGTWIRPALIRGIGLLAQGFALAGTLVGLFTIVIGIGPRTALDILIHTVMLAELAGGLIIVFRSRINPLRSSA